MPRISKQEQADQQRREDRLRDELREYEPYRQYLPLAKDLQDSVRALIEAKYPADGSVPDPETFQYDFEDVDDIVFARARERLIQEDMEPYIGMFIRIIRELRDKSKASMEQDHRAELYKRVLSQIEHEEGADIMEEVRQKIETNPEIAVDARDSARREIGARAMGVISDEISEKEQELVNATAERQRELDMLDVKFAFDKELDLASASVKKLIEVGDKLLLHCETKKGEKKTLVFVWTKDANDGLGWVCETPEQERLHYRKGNGDMPSISKLSDRFVSVGVVNRDLRNGRDVVQLDKLVVGLQPVIMPSGGKEHRIQYRDNSYYSSYDPITIVGTDFQTKDLVFTREKSDK